MKWNMLLLWWWSTQFLAPLVQYMYFTAAASTAANWPRWGILASGVCTLRPAHQDLHTEVPRTPTPSCAECMKYYKTLFKETQPMYFWMPAFYWQVTMLWWQFIWTHTHTNDIWRMLKNQINMIIWIWCIMNVLAELRIENVSQAGLPKYNI